MENENEIAGSIDDQAKDITDIRDTGGKAIAKPDIKNFVSDDPNANTQILDLNSPQFDNLQTINEESNIDASSLAKLEELSLLNDDDEDFIKFRERKDTIMTNIQAIG